MARVYSGKRPQNLKRTLGAVSRYLGRHRVLIALVAVLAALSASANLLGTYMIRPIVNQVVARGSVSGLMAGVGVTAAIYAVGVLSTLGYTQIMVRAAQKILLDIRRDLYHRLQTLPLRFFDQNRKGDLMSLFTNDVDTISDALNNSFAVVIQSMVQLFGMVLLLFLLNWRLSILVLVGYGVMFAYIRYSSKRSKFYFDRQQEHLGSLDGYIEEMMEGQKVVKVFTHEQQTLAGFHELNDQLKESAKQANAFSNIMMPVNAQLGNISYAICALVGAAMSVGGVGGMTLGTVVAFLSLNKGFNMPISQVSMQANSVIMALAGAERIFKMMDEPSETDEGYVTLVNAKYDRNDQLVETNERTGIWAWKHPHHDGTTTYHKLAGDITFTDVDFGYVPEKTVLHDINLYGRPGQKIAFVGSTGAGKTTITNLINRFYDIQEGKIRYDGINIHKIKKADLRRSLGIVLQDTHLFTGTVMENIRYGRLEATDEECIAAARLANADGFIKRLPEGYNTMLTGDGANLSQGQRQLLAIARAAVADPPVMILDEATSSIDTRTEAIVQQGMDSLMYGRTVFVIAHRLSTVRNSNAIMVLDHGRIVERGDHDDLIRQHGLYYQLYTGAFELE